LGEGEAGGDLGELALAVGAGAAVVVLEHDIVEVDRRLAVLSGCDGVRDSQVPLLRAACGDGGGGRRCVAVRSGIGYPRVNLSGTGG